MSDINKKNVNEPLIIGTLLFLLFWFLTSNFFLALFWVLFAHFSFYIAVNKGRNPMVAYFLTIIFGLPMLLIYWLLVGNKNVKKRN